MKAIIVHDPSDKNCCCLIPIDNINCITEASDGAQLITTIWLKTPISKDPAVPVAESMNELYEMMK